jgi:hypothetical protein
VAPAVQSTSVKLAQEDIDVFDSLMREAWDKPWWRRFVSTVEGRRTAFMSQLINDIASDNTRMEDKLRGQIFELSWIIAVDEYGKKLFLEKEARNG